MHVYHDPFSAQRSAPASQPNPKNIGGLKIFHMEVIGNIYMYIYIYI